MIDLAAGQAVLSAQPPVVEHALFCAQQTAEKALKSFLAWHDRSIPRTHDLVLVGDEVRSIDPTLDPWLGKVAPFTNYATKFRYPGSPPMPPLPKAVEALDIARAVLEAIMQRLPPEALP